MILQKNYSHTSIVQYSLLYSSFQHISEGYQMHKSLYYIYIELLE